MTWDPPRRLLDDDWVDELAEPNGIGPVCRHCHLLIDDHPRDHGDECPESIHTEWARDFTGVWHRMSSSAWSRGVGPADPVACCGRRIRSVDHSSIHPSKLDDGTETICAEPVGMRRGQCEGADIEALERTLVSVPRPDDDGKP